MKKIQIFALVFLGAFLMTLIAGCGEPETKVDTTKRPADDIQRDANGKK